MCRNMVTKKQVDVRTAKLLAYKLCNVKIKLNDTDLHGTTS